MTNGTPSRMMLCQPNVSVSALISKTFSRMMRILSHQRNLRCCLALVRLHLSTDSFLQRISSSYPQKSGFQTQKLISYSAGAASSHKHCQPCALCSVCAVCCRWSYFSRQDAGEGYCLLRKSFWWLQIVGPQEAGQAESTCPAMTVLSCLCRELLSLIFGSKAV